MSPYGVELRPDPLRELCVCPIFARDKEAPRPAWHIEIKYGWQAALLGPGEFLALLDDPFGANLQDRRGSRSLVHGSPERGARRRR